MEDFELPAYHGIRKLSLQTLEDMEMSDEFLQRRAAHQGFSTTENDYLGRNDPRWVDSTGLRVDLSKWEPGDHLVDKYLKE